MNFAYKIYRNVLSENGANPDNLSMNDKNPLLLSKAIKKLSQSDGFLHQSKQTP